MYKCWECVSFTLSAKTTKIFVHTTISDNFHIVQGICDKFPCWRLEDDAAIVGEVILPVLTVKEVVNKGCSAKREYTTETIHSRSPKFDSMKEMVAVKDMGTQNNEITWWNIWSSIWKERSCILSWQRVTHLFTYCRRLSSRRISWICSRRLVVKHHEKHKKLGTREVHVTLQDCEQWTVCCLLQ